MTKYSKDYEALETFLVNKLNEFQRGELSPWCEKHNLSVQEVSRFKNRNLKNTRPFFMKNMLEAFGYKDVKVETKTLFTFEE